VAEKRGTETRVEFRCGRRALIDYRRKHQLISQAASDLTIGFWELDQAIGRMQAEAKAARKQLMEADARLQQFEARDLLNSIEPRGGFGLITQTWLNRDAAYLKRMASLLVAQPKTVALLGASVVVVGLCALKICRSIWQRC
jgi:alanyl-tRNA synthetase